MTELETMQRAKQYIHKLANGIDPLTDRPLPHDTVLHQVRISRCFFYVETLIDRAIEQESHPAKVRKKELPPFSLTPEQKQQVLLVHNPIPISQFVQAANAVADLDHMQKLKATDRLAGAERLFAGGHPERQTPEGTDRQWERHRHHLRMAAGTLDRRALSGHPLQLRRAAIFIGPFGIGLFGGVCSHRVGKEDQIKGFGQPCLAARMVFTSETLKSLVFSKP